MRRMWSHNFFGVPNLGGWLTIANCVFFALCFLGLFGEPDIKRWSGALFAASAIFLSLPVGIFFILPQLDYSPTLSDIIGGAIAIGMNSII